MSIKRFTTFCLILTALLLLLLLLTVYRAYEIQNDITDKERYQFNTNMFAIELFQSSEDLTRMARSYVVTGDRFFKDDFFNRIIFIEADRTNFGIILCFHCLFYCYLISYVLQHNHSYFFFILLVWVSK